MKGNPVLTTLIGMVMLCSTAVAAPTQPSTLKKRVLADLDCIKSIFEVKYAPKPWKEEFAAWYLEDAISDAKRKVNKLPSPTIKDCQVILRDFFNSTRDYHVGVKFYSTESASLPFLVKGAQGRYFVCYVNREITPIAEFPFEEGDEILAFGGKPIHDVISELRVKEYGNNTFETDQALAELTLTQRRGDLGHLVPKGEVKITGLKKGETTRTTISMNWFYSPEKIRDFSKLATVDMASDFSQQGPSDLSVREHAASFFNRNMVFRLWDKSYVGAFSEMNKHALGARRSFIPALGNKTWRTSSESYFDAYIFEAPSGKKIGYIRLPHYLGDQGEVEEFGELMNLFENRTDALVIDQINNPGGSVFYLYALASIFADKAYEAPKHHLALTQEEIYLAHFLLTHLDTIKDELSAHEVLGDNMGGYPVDYQFAVLMRQFCNFMVSQWNQGKVLTDPTFLFGVDKINPHPRYHYSKPVLLLVNSLDFSGGDFFPAILQDNQRVTVLGTRTAGAGGYVLGTEYPNHSGMKGFAMTGSLAKRIDQQPIENLGVIPDVPYELTPVDLQENYQEYVKAILEAVEGLTQGSSS